MWKYIDKRQGVLSATYNDAKINAISPRLSIRSILRVRPAYRINAVGRSCHTEFIYSVGAIAAFALDRIERMKCTRQQTLNCRSRARHKVPTISHQRLLFGV
jgi:hypothetical protein